MDVPQTELIFTRDGAELLRCSVPPGEYTLGRNPDCEVRVQTELISRRHAKLTVNFQEVFIEDLGSSNGTFVAGQPIKECTQVFPGQPVSLGTVKLDIRRIKSGDTTESLSPFGETLQRVLPREFLGDRRYAVGNIIARGGMGAILEAEENVLKRKVAMKRMLGTHSEDGLMRFVEEAQITAQLDHPNIVPVYELNLDEHDNVYYTMKLVRGITLHKVLGLLSQGTEGIVKKYPLAALLTIFQKVCDAIAFAHSKGVLHRDLKPENIMLGEYGEVMVMDWGLARASGRKQGSHGPERTIVRSARQEAGQMTMMGMVVGTPQYMAPEQARGETMNYDARTDIYALGALLYHILTLELPVDGEDPEQVMRSVIEGKVGQKLDAAAGPKAIASDKPLPHIPGGKIPPSLAAIVRRAMALQQADRYTSVQEMQADLEAFQGGVTAASSAAGAALPKWALAVIAVFALAVVALTVLLLRR